MARHSRTFRSTAHWNVTLYGCVLGGRCRLRPQPLDSLHFLNYKS